MLRHLLLPFLMLSAVICCAQDAPPRRERIINIFGTRSAIFLGSEDRRAGFGASIQWLKPDKRLGFRNYPAKLMYEAYASHTNGRVTSGNVRGTSTLAVGGLVQARFEFPAGGVRMFVDLGFGVQVANRPSHDLDTRVNTTPTMSLGIVVGKDRPVNIALRLLHVSNGGTNKPNRGQNQLQLMVGVRL